MYPESNGTAMLKNGLRLLSPPCKILLRVFGVFLLSNLIHFVLLINTEFFASANRDLFLFDGFSLALGLMLGILFNTLIAAVLVFIQLVGLDEQASQWFRAPMIMSILFPFAPLVDLILHHFQWIPYTGYSNLFHSDVDTIQRLRDSLIPGFADPVVILTWGHRCVFVLLALVNAFFVFKFTRQILRTTLVFLTSYVSVCGVLAFLSPSDVQPTTLLLPLLVIAVLSWVPNVFLIGRNEFTATNKAR